MDRLASMQAFVRVVEYGSFSAAAERLGVAKSAVSRRVGELEGHLGVRLLQRTTRRVGLTDSGRAFYERAVRILADLEEAEQAVSSEQRELRGRLRVAAPLSFGLLHLAPALERFLALHPELQLEMDLNDRNVDLVEEGFDVGVRIGSLKDSSLVARRIAPVLRVVCASPSYLAQHGEPKAPEDLARHQGLTYSNVPEGQQWQFLDARGERISVRVPTRLRANNGDILLRAALAGLGITVLPTFITHEAVKAGRLRLVLRDWALPAEAVYAVYPSGRFLPRRVRSFIDHLVDQFGEAPYWDKRDVD